MSAPKAIALCLALALSATPQSQSPRANTFTVREVFGVSHPRQIIDFDLPAPLDPTHACVVGPDGKPVPFQILSGAKLAVETDLPPFAERTWTLCTHPAPPVFDGGIEVKTAAGWYEITNRLTGIRIAKPVAGSANDRGPVQGILYRNGVWTATGPNYLLDQRDTRLTAKTFEVHFLEKGPLKVVVQAVYAFDRPPLVYGGRTLIAGGAGYYRSTIEIEAHQPSIMVEEDTDMDLRYQLEVSAGLDPDQARYRGHHSTSLANGRQQDGQVYAPFHERPPQDAIRDLPYSPPGPSCYTSSPPCIRRLAIWDPWVYDSGWYWQLYNSSAGPRANLFGIFAGRASHALGAAFNGPGIYTAIDGTGHRAAGVRLEINRRTPDARVFARVRLEWGIFMAVKGEDLAPLLQVQNIARQMNLRAGFNLNKIHRYDLHFQDSRFASPGNGNPSLYMNRPAAQNMVDRVRNQEWYFRYLYNAESTARPLLDFWHTPSPAAAGKVADGIAGLAHDLLDEYVNGDGIYSFRFHYWHGGLEMSRQATWINALLASPDATPADRARATAAAVLFANVLWDDDFVPLFDGHGLNLGTENMPVQQSEYRDLFALFLAAHPAMRDHAHLAVSHALADLHATVSETGAHMGSTHYIDASMGPLLSALQQMQTAGIADPFKTVPRLAAFADFYINLLTPPEARFGGSRKVVAIGDGAAESSELYGQLGTAFAAADPVRSAGLMWAWKSSSAFHSGFHSTTILKIDDTLRSTDPSLRDADFPGWYSTLRNAWGTASETAVWFVNGDFYRDHAHEDNGNLIIYALGSPLSIDWGSMYYPPTPGAVLHNAPIPESRMKAPWDADSQPLEVSGFRWTGAVREAFESFAQSAHVRASFTLAAGSTARLKWTRSVYSLHPDPSFPVLLIRDDFAGAGANAPKILSLNLMAAGPVDTPAGSVSPAQRIYVDRDGGRLLPSASAVQQLAAGPNRFGFTGQSNIDFDVYALPDEPGTQALIGNWGHVWAPNFEQAQFLKANGHPFVEQQDILRLRGTGSFNLVLLPRHKNEKRDSTVTSVTRNESRLTVKSGDGTTTFDNDSYVWQSPAGITVASFGHGPASGGGITISGGPTEVSLAGGDVTITAHGAPGMRRIRVPGGSWDLDYKGGKPQTCTAGDLVAGVCGWRKN